MNQSDPAAATLATAWQPSAAWLVGTAAAIALLLVLRSRGRVDRAWAALLVPGAWRWGVVLAGLGVALCLLPAIGALPAVLGADCQAAVGALSLLKVISILLLVSAAGGVLCLAARAMLLPVVGTAAAPLPARWKAWPEVGRAVGITGLACLAFAWASVGHGLSALARGADGSVLPVRAAWAAQARETCRLEEAALPTAPALAVAGGATAVQPAAPLPVQPTAAAAGSPTQERLLGEIRDLLREQQRRGAQAVSLPPIPPAYVPPPRPEPARPEPRPTVRRPVPTSRPAVPFYGYPYEY